MAGINKQRYMWLGPTVGKGDVTEHFLAFVERKAMMDASSFAELDNPGNVANMLSALAERRNLPGLSRMHSVGITSPASC